MGALFYSIDPGVTWSPSTVQWWRTQ